ncbi:hypothetical protein GCM10023194_06820 [Planotetraspora phitsanulokensis]|uniref:DUF3180 domain-containing protein n=1 Tax=Planotetraspora phitsanulokensis TaxID=575192 RepID=A0A8J3U5T9_9ACTN|nr:DUF3180 domain-containing protein [Planotetraspora phitsanulokensis]GII39178.1 hypothetical protein Pph01_41810 [Planotetraspora phitsanulokensis]
MKPSNPGVLVGLIIVFALATWGVLQELYSEIPTVPWTAIPTLLLLAIGEAYTGWLTRARILRKPDTKPVEPLAVARLAALAKATAYAGAVFGGIFAGFVLRVLNLLDLPKPRQDVIVAGGSFLACVALICAALFLEYCCRVPGKPEDEE